MKTLGIVCEYNPFHNGHKYHIEKAKELFGCDAAVCAMSGSLVQRGEVSVFDKWTRAKNAVKYGADLVLEIPAFFCLQSSEKYAFGAIKLLEMLGGIDVLCFGSESGNIDFLKKIANAKQTKEFNNAVATLMRSGMSYPAATETAIKKIISFSDDERIFSPNNLLGIEYINAIKSLNSKIEPVTVKRRLTDHFITTVSENFATAGEIRKMLANGNNSNCFLPYDPDGFDIFDEKYAESFILGYFRLICPKKKILGGEDGIAERLIKCAGNAHSLEEFYSSATSRRYTESRIKRISKCAVLDIKKNARFDYMRPLAFNDRGREILKTSPNKNLIVSKLADFVGSKNSMLKYDIAATDFAYLCAKEKSKRKSGADFYTPPVYVKM